MPSIFSRIIAGEIPCHKIWEDDRFFAFLDIKPIQPGHTLLVPKQEVDDVVDLDDGTYTALFLAAKRLMPAIQRATGSARVGIVVEGLEVPHVHLKLIPISKPHDLAQENAKDAIQEELVEMAEKIRSALSSRT
jgi:histidine triad (HIT) family protein